MNNETKEFTLSEKSYITFWTDFIDYGIKTFMCVSLIFLVFAPVVYPAFKKLLLLLFIIVGPAFMFGCIALSDFLCSKVEEKRKRKILERRNRND